MHSSNWPASNVWVFIAQSVEHCSANAEATGSNPVKFRKKYIILKNYQVVSGNKKDIFFPDFSCTHEHMYEYGPCTLRRSNVEPTTNLTLPLQRGDANFFTYRGGLSFDKPLSRGIVRYCCPIVGSNSHSHVTRVVNSGPDTVSLCEQNKLILG